MHGTYARILVAMTAIVAVFLPSSLWAGGDGWTDNVKDAMATAQKQNKDLLMDFTGSDWCGWCIQLDSEVFSQAPFKAEAPKHFVLVELDFPQSKELTAEVKQQNDEWARKLGIQGYPTIILADAKGKPYAKTGYRPGGAEPYLKHLDELHEARVVRDQALAKAEKVQGIERAKLLDEALSKIDDELVMSAYGEQVDEIVKLDADNAAGLKSKYDLKRTMQQINESLAHNDLKSAAEKVEAALQQKPTGQAAQDLHLMRSQIRFSGDDKAGARQSLDDALAAAPEGGKVDMIHQIIERYFTDADEAGEAKNDAEPDQTTEDAEAVQATEDAPAGEGQ